MNSPLARRALAEFVGTALLLTAIVGSGIAAQRLAPTQPGLQLLVNSLVTGAALVALILALQPISAAFNPLVTLLERALGAITTGHAAALTTAQLAGGLLGCLTAAYWFTSSTSFANPAVTLARTLSDTYAGIAPASVAMFVAMQLVGAAVGYALIRALYPLAAEAAVQITHDPDRLNQHRKGPP